MPIRSLYNYIGTIIPCSSFAGAGNPHASAGTNLRLTSKLASADSDPGVASAISPGAFRVLLAIPSAEAGVAWTFFTTAHPGPREQPKKSAGHSGPSGSNYLAFIKLASPNPPLNRPGIFGGSNF